MPDALDDLLSEMVNNEPRVNEGVVANLEGSSPAVEVSPTPTPTPTPIPRQVYVPPEPVKVADTFDPAIHSVNPDGTPRRNRDGSYAKKRGRKPSEPATPPTPRNESDFRNIAVFITSIGFTTAEQALGPVWEPQPAERTQIEESFAAYAKSRNMADIPPGIALVLSVGLYALPRISHPETKARLRQHAETLGIIKKTAPRRVVEEVVESVPVAVVNPNPTLRSENGTIISETARKREVVIGHNVYGDPIYGSPGTGMR